VKHPNEWHSVIVLYGFFGHCTLARFGRECDVKKVRRKMRKNSRSLTTL